MTTTYDYNPYRTLSAREVDLLLKNDRYLKEAGKPKRQWWSKEDWQELHNYKGTEKPYYDRASKTAGGQKLTFWNN